MASTPENNLRLDLPDVGSDDNTWGTLLNTLLGYVELFEDLREDSPATWREGETLAGVDFLV